MAYLFKAISECSLLYTTRADLKLNTKYCFYQAFNQVNMLKIIE